MRPMKQSPEENFEITGWMEAHGFPQYSAAFKKNDIGEKELFDLTEENLREMGVDSLGERKRMMREISRHKKAKALGAAKKIGNFPIMHFIVPCAVAVIMLFSFGFQANFFTYDKYRSLLPSYENQTHQIMSLLGTATLVSLFLAAIILRKSKSKASILSILIISLVVGIIVSYIINVGVIFGWKIREPGNGNL